MLFVTPKHFPISFKEIATICHCCADGLSTSTSQCVFVFAGLLELKSDRVVSLLCNKTPASTNPCHTVSFQQPQHCNALSDSYTYLFLTLSQEYEILYVFVLIMNVPEIVNYSLKQCSIADEARVYLLNPDYV